MYFFIYDFLCVIWGCSVRSFNIIHHPFTKNIYSVVTTSSTCNETQASQDLHASFYEVFRLGCGPTILASTGHARASASILAKAMASEGTASRVLDLAMDHDDAVSRVPAPMASHDRGRGE